MPGFASSGESVSVFSVVEGWHDSVSVFIWRLSVVMELCLGAKPGKGWTAMGQFYGSTWQAELIPCCSIRH